MSKDLFSKQAKDYARYRPSYPSELVDYILSFTESKTIAWDCATGNGQLAVLLAPHFEKVIATDISEQQLSLAVQQANIHYEKQTAEVTSFPDSMFNLITVAQAYHWFDQKRFEGEVIRVGKRNAVIAIIGYNLLSVNESRIDKLIKDFYSRKVGRYWDPGRKFLEENYDGISFNFADIHKKEFTAAVQYSREDFAGYLSSWSAVQHFIAATGVDPVPEFIASINNYWKAGELKQIAFPLFIKLGRIVK